MTRAKIAFTLFLALAAGALGGDPAPCKCAILKEQFGGWCNACNVGYVASVRIASRQMFEAIDAHGHDVDLDTFHCDSCQTAIRTNGFCRTCKVGFVDKKAYFSKLTWVLARGRVVPSASITCPQCRKHIGKPGWCDTCEIGMVGHVAFRDRDLFTQASKAHAVLLQAIAALKRCEPCGIAMAIDRECYRCKKFYEDGKVVEPPAPPE